MIGLATAAILTAGRNFFQQAVVNENHAQRIAALEKGMNEMPERVSSRVLEALRERAL